jgi:CBS domain-containing membrane protein
MRTKLLQHVKTVKYIIFKETLIDPKEHVLTFIGAFIGIGLIGFLDTKYLNPSDNIFLIGSFGASAVLIYGIVNSPFAQPRNLVGGHVISALIGVTIHKLIPGEIWLSCALSVALSIVLMQVTKTLHPPGGATALLANIGSPRIMALGFMYVLSPVLSGAIILLVVALIFNNIGHRSYPNNKGWYKLRRRYKQS